MKLTASSMGFEPGSYASGQMKLENGESRKVSLIADGTVDHEVWGALTAARPELADQFIPSLHDPRFHNGGRAGGGDEFGQAWVKGSDADGHYSQLGESDGVHQRVYAYPARVKTVTQEFVHTIEGDVNFDQVDTLSIKESLEVRA